MADKTTVVVHFHMEESAKQEVVAKMPDIFANIVNEETFVAASLVQGMRDPQSILNYEVWNPRRSWRTRWARPIAQNSRKWLSTWRLIELQRGIPPAQSGKQAESLERTITDAMEVMWMMQVEEQPLPPYGANTELSNQD
jgi:quinol monooxygenase YgiN